MTKPKKNKTTKIPTPAKPKMPLIAILTKLIGTATPIKLSKNKAIKPKKLLITKSLSFKITRTAKTSKTIPTIAVLKSLLMLLLTTF